MSTVDPRADRRHWSWRSVACWGVFSGLVGATLLLLHVALLAPQEIAALERPILFVARLALLSVGLALLPIAAATPIARRSGSGGHRLLTLPRLASLGSLLPATLSWVAFSAMDGQAGWELGLALTLAGALTYLIGGALLARLERLPGVVLGLGLAAAVVFAMWPASSILTERSPSPPALPRVESADETLALDEVDPDGEEHDAPAPARAVILLTIDTLRADRLGSYGYRRPTSPNIDSLAREGLLIERMIAASSGTIPSMVTLLSGLAPPCHGVTDQTGYLHENIASLSERFRTAGYRTFGLAANRVLDEARGFDQGFDTFANLDDAPAGDLARLFDQFLATEERSDPLFAWIHFMDPHAPYQPDTAHGDLFLADDSYSTRRLPAVDYGSFSGVKVSRALGEAFAGRKWVEEGHLAALYDAEIRTVDDAIGAIRAALSEHYEPDATIIGLFADHGETFARSPRDPYFQHALDVYESTVRVPAILWAPGRIPAGARDATPRDHTDVMPVMATLAELPDLDALTEHRVRSGETSKEIRVSQTAWWDALSLELLELSRRRPTHAVYRGDLKLIVRPHGELEKISGPLSLLHAWRSTVAGHWRKDEMFDLAADPDETTDIGSIRSAEQAELHDRLDEYLASSDAPDCASLRSESVQVDEETLDDLRALGYLD